MIQRCTQTLTVLTLTVTIALLAAPLFAQSVTGEMGNSTQPAGDISAAAPGQIVCTVTDITGTPMFQTGEDQPRQALEVGQVLPVGTIIMTAVRDRVDLALGPNADVTIGRLSRVTIGRLKQEGDSIRTLLGVQRGKVDFHVKRIGFDNDFKVATPTGTMAVRGTEGSVTVDDQTDIDGNPNNGGNSINFGQNNDGSNNNLTGNQQYDGTGGSSGGGGVTDGYGHDTGGGSNTSNNSNNGDGNGNDPGDILPDTSGFNGNDSFNGDQNEFQDDINDGGQHGGAGGDR